MNACSAARMHGCTGVRQRVPCLRTAGPQPRPQSTISTPFKLSYVISQGWVPVSHILRCRQPRPEMSCRPVARRVAPAWPHILR